MPAETLRLSDACHRIGADYQVAYRAAVSRRIPAERDERGNRWMVKAADLPVIAETLGVDPVAA